MEKNFWKTVGFVKGIVVSAQVVITILAAIAGAIAGIYWVGKGFVEPLKAKIKKMEKKEEGTEEVDEAA